MAPSVNHTNADLASRLIDHADSITNAAAHEMEVDLRLAAERLRLADEPTPVVVELITRLRQVAAVTGDSDTRTALRSMLGEYASA
jgi:hypothetical protein